MIGRHIFLTLFFYSCHAGPIFPYPNCGLDLGLDSVPTVFNGNESKPHTYPWMVFVCGGAITNNQGGIDCNESCGGSIISPKWIVTAAHCVADADVDNTVVVIGAHNVEESFKNFDYRFISDIIIHPEYKQIPDGYKYSQDIALLELEDYVQFGPKINALCLPDISDTENSFEDEIGIVAGWGTTSYKNIGGKSVPVNSKEKLLEARVSIISNNQCKRLSQRKFNFLESFHLCTYNDYDRSSHCPGDSGGPLFIRDKRKDGRFKLLAVASFGMTKSCGTYPAGFARLTKSVLQWIFKYFAETWRRSDDIVCKSATYWDCQTSKSTRGLTQCRDQPKADKCLNDSGKVCTKKTGETCRVIETPTNATTTTTS